LFTGGAVQTAALPASIAGLPAWSAMVCVGPPLFAKPAGSSRGFVLLREKPHVAPSSMLWPPSVTLPAQLPPAVLLATMVLVTVSGPGLWMSSLEMLPPKVALLPVKVLLVTVSVP
jgi:hypothetical protein